MLRSEVSQGVRDADRILSQAYQNLAQGMFEYNGSCSWPSTYHKEASEILLNAIAHIWGMPRVERGRYHDCR